MCNVVSYLYYRGNASVSDDETCRGGTMGSHVRRYTETTCRRPRDKVREIPDPTVYYGDPVVCLWNPVFRPWDPVWASVGSRGELSGITAVYLVPWGLLERPMGSRGFSRDFLGISRGSQGKSHREVNIFEAESTPDHCALVVFSVFGTVNATRTLSITGFGTEGGYAASIGVVVSQLMLLVLRVLEVTTKALSTLAIYSLGLKYTCIICAPPV